ncbi:chondroitinase-B domain-containing protein [Bizionia sp. KMM 8389]
MQRFLIVLSLCLAISSCTKPTQTLKPSLVHNIDELNKAIDSAKAGDEIVMANGVWTDVSIQLKGVGTEKQPITLKAETPGLVSIEGASKLEIGGEYLQVEGLYFKNGYTPGASVIRFKINDTLFANHSKVSNIVIEEFTQPDRDDTDHWVEFWGRHNELSNSYIAGKSNFGPTVMVVLKGNEHIKNHHKIVNNHFGPRPRKGGPHGETMQIGDSGTSMAPSHTYVANNLFEKCNGEVEIISSKSNYNVFKNNVFFESEGSLVLRHGNYATIDGNMFIGNDNSPFIGGIRVINTGHWITNNYFYKLKGNTFRAPLAVMNGIPKSPQNRYNQVTDVVMAYNTFVECQTPFHFSVGSNVSQSAVLPKSEIRSARPKRTTLANNVIYNETAFNYPIKNYDKVDGVNFVNNYTNNPNDSEVKPKGLIETSMTATTLSDYVILPKVASDKIYTGFDFDTIETDMFGTERTENNNAVGAIISADENRVVIDKSKYGTPWFNAEKEIPAAKVAQVSNSETLISSLKSAASGDIITLSPGTYTLNQTLVINKHITLKSEDETKPAVIEFTNNDVAFEMHPKGTLKLEAVSLKGNEQLNTFATLDKNMSKAYNLFLDKVEIANFNRVLETSKGSFADTVSVKNSLIKNCKTGVLLNKETNDKGDYNSEFVIIENTIFNNVSGTILDYYRGGYDESTIGGNLVFVNNEVTNSGKASTDNILIKNRGIVNVRFADNNFSNNPVRTIAVLWGEKSQKPENNQIQNSGEIKVVQNLKLKLMY